MRRSDCYFFGVIFLAISLIIASFIGIKIPLLLVKFWFVLFIPYVFIKMVWLFSGGRWFNKAMDWFDTEI